VTVNNNSELLKKFCIVTGGASGIGAATVQLLAQRGATVIALDLNSSELEKKTDALKSEPGKVHGRHCDLSDEASIRRIFDEFSTISLEALFNIAALPSPGLDISQLESTEWDRIMDVNCKSIFLTSKYALPLFINNKHGVIVNTTSVHAYASAPNMSVYAASKGAVISLTTQLALELNKYKIRVVGIAPGSVNTPMTTLDLEKDREKLLQLGLSTDGYSIGHVGDPFEIAEALLWIATPKASFVNGTTLVVDGGLLSRLFNY
jgi:3-oxoacyl-[acyl-carrier protein] reductase